MTNFLKSHRKWLSIVQVIAGNCIYALAVKLFLLPANLISSGTTGIALTLDHLFGIPMTAFILVFNIVMLCVGWAIMGKKFAMTTILSSLFYPIALEVLNRTLGDVVITENLLLNTLFAGMGLGLSLGIVMRAGASTGGMDIPPLVLQKFFRIPVAVSLWAFDFIIMLAQMLFHTPEDLLYGILLLISTSVTLNQIMIMGTSKTEVKIISDKAEEIRDGILSRMDRGCTLLHGESGYMHQPLEVILSIMSNYELPKIERLARDIDPDCFMIVSRVSEVWGRGFTLGKQYKKEKPQK